MTTNGCVECIVFKVNKGIVEPNICENCGKQEMIWKQSEVGTLYLECSNCHDTIAVDLNTPCELDPVFNQKVKMTVSPKQKIPEKEVIVELSKVFKVNAVGMRKLFIEGISEEVTLKELDVMIPLLNSYGISYKLENFEDCKQKYPFYKECKYPYSAMRIFKNNYEGGQKV